MVDGTLDAVFRVFAWSVNVMLEGTWPAENWFGRKEAMGGKQLADGWSGALCQVRGDWAFYAEVFRFPQWNSVDRMCWLCRASSTARHLSWTDARPGAGWRATRWSHEAYIDFLRNAGIVIPVLLLCIVGFRLECVMVDTLHTVDLGVASHAIGNTMWHFAVKLRVFGGATQEAAIAALNKHPDGWYKTSFSSSSSASKIQGKVTVERIRTSKSWPKLKAKAAATRHLAKYALYLVQTFGRPEDRAILAVCQLLVEFYQLINDEPLFMSASGKARIATVGQKFAIIYSSLSQQSLEAGERMWKLMPKLHMFVHLCEWQAGESGNPRSYWTYADEDLVGLLVEVAQSCHTRTMAPSALFKWMHVYFE